jgi:uncharacterized repeat protein (TIGR02543 family)
MSHPERTSPASRLAVAVLALAVLLGGLTLVGPAHAATIDGLTGEGTAADPIIIDSADDLDAVAAAVNGDVETHGSSHLRLDSDIDYGGGSFAGIHRFSGVFDGNGHTISNAVLESYVDGTVQRAAFFGTLQDATVRDLTLAGLTARLTGTVAQGASEVAAAGLATMATSSHVAGVTLRDATVRNEIAAGTQYIAGFIGRVSGTEAAPSLVTDNAIVGAHTVYTTTKYSSAFLGYHGAYATVSRNLVAADPDSAHMSQNAAGGAYMNSSVLVNYVGANVQGQEISDNVVLSGSVYSHATGTLGNTVSWIAGYNHGDVETYGTNLVNSDHNRAGFPETAETAAAGHALRWTRRSGANYQHDAQGGALWVLGNDGTAATPTQLREPATYEALGWDLEDVWRWDAETHHPVLRVAETPVAERPVITVESSTASYRVGESPTLAELLERFGADVDRGVLGVDLSGVDFGTVGTYPALVTATDGDEEAVPVQVTIEVIALAGSGTPAAPYLVDTVADLDVAVAMVNADTAAAGASKASFRLTADLDYEGEAFATFRRFTGTFDGNDHTISNLTLVPGTDVDPSDANSTQTGFVQILGGTIKDLTLVNLSSITEGGSGARVQQGGLAGRVSGATITGSALIKAEVRSSANTENSSAVGGVVGKSVGADNTISNNLLAGVTVSGDKRVGGVIGWQNSASTVSDNLVLDTAVTQNGSSGAGAGLVTGHTVFAGELTGNVVLSGQLTQSGPANYGWIRSAQGGTSSDNLVNANNNIDPDEPVGHTSVPNPNPYDVFWSGSSTLATAGQWTRGDLGAYVTRDDLARQETYEGLGWDFDGDWTWDAVRTHPVPSGVDFPSVPVTIDLAGGTDEGAGVTEQGFATTTTLTNPTRAGYDFSGWTGTDIGGTSRNVTLPRYPAGALEYAATWTPITYALSYQLAGGTVSGNPLTYTVESPEFDLVSPTRDGYTFAGWTGTGLTGASVAVTVPTGSTGTRTYTATWTPERYAVDYDLAGGEATGDNPTSYGIEDPAFTLANPTRAGYTFGGWTGSDLTEPSASVTVPAGSTGERQYVATWTPVTYHLVYRFDEDVDFDGPAPGEYTIESEAFTLPVPVRPGYAFAGWTGTGLSEPTLEVVVPAGSTGTRIYEPTWTVRTYDITYRLAGGKVAAGNPSTYTVASAPFTLTNPTRLNHIFAGWSGLGATRSTLTVPTGTTGDLTLTATWRKRAKARSVVSASYVKKAKKQKNRTKVRVSVRTVSGYSAPAGRVRLTVTGRAKVKGVARTVSRTAKGTLRNGKVTIRIPRGGLPRGKFRITATYAGNTFYTSATSKALSFNYKK